MDEANRSFNPPSPDIYAELVNFLELDTKLYGQIFRKKRYGISNEEIQKSRGAQSPGFIWNSWMLKFEFWALIGSALAVKQQNFID